MWRKKKERNKKKKKALFPFGAIYFLYYMLVLFRSRIQDGGVPMKAYHSCICI